MHASTAGDLPVALSIAGSDSGAGAGIQADLLTFAALGAFGTTAITCVTAQHPDGVSAVEALPPALVAEQARQVLRGFAVRAAKTGMLYDEAIIAAVAAVLREHPALPVVVDPVMVATSGARLLRPEAEAALAREILPRATVVTPNLDEAAVLLGAPIATADEAVAAAEALRDRFGTAILLKGGHLPGDRVVDVLARPGHAPEVATHRRVLGVHTHGTGCTLSAAIAAGLAHGMPLAEAVAAARAYLLRAFAHPARVGGRAYLGHLPS